MGTAKRRELYDQHQDAPLDTGRGQPNNPNIYHGSRDYQGSQRSSNYSYQEVGNRSYQNSYDYSYEVNRGSNNQRYNEQRSQGSNTFYPGNAQNDWRDVQYRRERG